MCCINSVVTVKFVIVYVGESITIDSETIGLNEQVIIDCSQFIDHVGDVNPDVTWYIDGIPILSGSVMNVKISADNRLCLISNTSLATNDQLGSYTCVVNVVSYIVPADCGE